MRRGQWLCWAGWLAVGLGGGWWSEIEEGEWVGVVEEAGET